jgi:hypothetical protein
MKRIVILNIFIFFLISSLAIQAQEKQVIKNLLSEEDLKIFATNAVQKTKELTNYINTITDKTLKDNEIKLNAVDLAVNLFVSEDNLVEVSNKNRVDVSTYKIREYLNKLRVLPYTKVKITYYDIQYISEFKKGTDGKYYGVITFFQKFEGFIENRPVYSDVTQKNVEVIIDKVTTIYGSKKVERWNVLLGNITVAETK